MSFATLNSTLTKSLEIGPYNAKNVNRIRFDLVSDDQLTDLSQSYLRLNVTVLDSSGNIVDVSNNILGNNQVLAFGQHGQTYSAASMVRTARLLELRTMTYLEEIPYCNVYTQSVTHQVLNDFESLIANTLHSGTAMDFNGSVNGSMEAGISSFTVNPREVHIYLKDLFSVCRSNAFLMGEVGGLRVELELEPTQNLFQTIELPQQVPALPTSMLDASGNVVPGFTPEASVDYKSFYSPTQFNNSNSSVYLPSPLNTLSPEGWLYTKTLYLVDDYPFWGPDPTITSKYILLKPHYSAANFASLNIFVGNLIILNFVNSGVDITGQVIEEKFTRCCRIEGLTTTAGVYNGVNYGSIIEIDNYIAQSDTPLTGWTTQLESFLILYADASGNAQSAQIVDYTTSQGSNPNLEALVIANACNISVVSRNQLLKWGLIDSNNIPNKDMGFKMAIDTYASDTINGLICAEPEIYGVGISGRTATASNQSFRIGFVNESPKIKLLLPILDGSGTPISYDLFFEDLYLNEDNGPWKLIITAPTLSSPHGVVELSVAWGLTIYAVTNIKNKTLLTNNVNYTYSIDRAEIVQIKTDIPKGFKMNPLYLTNKVEIVDIQNELTQFSRQFILEPNCLSCFLLSPQFTPYLAHEAGLLSQARNVGQYRFSIDQIQNTNRLVQVLGDESQYISPLQIEKMYEAHSNVGQRIRNLQGLNNVESVAHPVVYFPIKIYSGAVPMMSPNGGVVTQLIPNNQQKLLQVDLYGLDVLNKILPAPIFLFKTVIQSFAKPSN